MSDKIDLVLGAVGGYQWDQVNVWALSLMKSGFTGVGAVIVYDDNKTVIENFKSLGFQVIQLPLRGTVYNQRFYDFHEVMYPQRDQIRYAVVTDVRDVFFQSDPTKWIDQSLSKKADILACSESMLYKDEPWGDDNVKKGYPDLAHRVLNKPIYNVGVLAGRGPAVMDLCLAIGATAKSSGFPVADQSGYNLLLDMEPYASKMQHVPSEHGFACQCGTMADPNKIDQFRPLLLEPEPYLDDDGVKTSKGHLYPIVHQYDRVPEWNRALRIKLNEKLKPLS